MPQTMVPNTFFALINDFLRKISRHSQGFGIMKYFYFDKFTSEIFVATAALDIIVS